MLSDEEENAFHTSINRVRTAVADHLGRTQNVDQAIIFITQLHRNLDELSVRATIAGPAPECKKGCSYCCSARVEATDPEILLIARHVRTMPMPRVSHIIEQLRNHVAVQSYGSHRTRQQCSFLEEGQCSIYDVRPGACRKAHSLSAMHCAENSPEIPQNLKLLLDAEALMTGTSEAYGDVALPASAHELNAAVLGALLDDSAESRWYQMERPNVDAT